MTPYTNISIIGIHLDTDYICGVAAINDEGIGPKTSLQFSLSSPDEGGVSEESGFSMNVYSLIPAGVVALLAIMMIFPLVIVVCYYRHKLNL